MNWHPVRPIDRRTNARLPATPYAIRSGCGRFQVTKLLSSGTPGYLLYDMTTTPPRLLDTPAFTTADQAKQHVEGIHADAG